MIILTIIVINKNTNDNNNTNNNNTINNNNDMHNNKQNMER